MGILALGATITLLYFGRIFFITIVIASMIAFLLEPVVELFMKLKLPRGLASFLVCSIALMALYLACLGLYTQGLAMADDLPAYGTRINDIVESFATRMDRIENNVYNSLMPKRFQGHPAIENPPASAAATKGKRKKSDPAVLPLPEPVPVPEVRLQQEPTSSVTYLYTYLRDFYDVLLMASFVPFLVYFLLSWRDYLRSRFLYLFEGDSRRAAADAWAGVGDMVRAYVIGNFLLGILLSVASGILFASVKLPYPLVVAPASGFLNLVPYIGLPLALIPPLIAALPVSGDPALYLFLATSVALLHLLALNLLYPKFVGARVHLNPMAVTVALMFWGMLWGGIGLLLAIPLTAGLKAVCDNVSSLQPYGRLLGDH